MTAVMILKINNDLYFVFSIVVPSPDTTLFYIRLRSGLLWCNYIQSFISDFIYFYQLKYSLTGKIFSDKIKLRFLEVTLKEYETEMSADE